jgi:L-serine dehydratase
VFELEDADGNLIVIRGSSLGGGDVVISQIDAFEVEVTGDLPVLVVAHVDRPGVIAGVTGLLAESGVNVASMQVSRAKRGASALMLIVTDAEVDPARAEMISRQSGVTSVRRVPAV